MIRGVPLFRSEDRKSKIETPPGQYLDPARDDDDDDDFCILKQSEHLGTDITVTLHGGCCDHVATKCTSTGTTTTKFTTDLVSRIQGLGITRDPKRNNCDVQHRRLFHDATLPTPPNFDDISTYI